MPLTLAAKILRIHTALAGHVPGAPQWPCALANRDVNEISQSFHNIRIQEFQLQWTHIVSE